METETASTSDDMLEADMINRLAKTDAHFKHQQRGEPDLTCQEKSAIAYEIFNKSPALFLERFSQFLTLADTECFKRFSGNYQVDFYMKEIYRRCADTSRNLVKNRRYQALKVLMDAGDYFSEDEMKWRDPLLYEQMIGQYESDSEKTEKMEQEIDRTDLKFSTILLKHMDNQTNKQYFELLKEKEALQILKEDIIRPDANVTEEQEEEEEDEESDEEIDDTELKENSMKQHESNAGENEAEVTSVEKAYLRTEFLRIMQERFLSGDDSNFDYSKIDSNAEYDALDIVGHDAEEKYFDNDGELSEEDDGGGDRLLMKKLECIGLETRIDDDCKDEDYMKFVPSEDTSNKDS